MRFDRGDEDVLEAVQQFRALTDEMMEIINSVDEEEALRQRMADVMDRSSICICVRVLGSNRLLDSCTRNFDLRRKLLGDDVIGCDNLSMIEVLLLVICATLHPREGLVTSYISEKKRTESSN